MDTSADGTDVFVVALIAFPILVLVIGATVFGPPALFNFPT